MTLLKPEREAVESHEVVLLGKKYRLRSPHDEEYLGKLAHFVTGQVADVQRRGAFVGSSPRWRRNSRKLKGRMTVAIPRPRSEVCTSRESIRAEDPETTTSIFSESITRRTKRSQPGTSCTSSRKYQLRSVRAAG